MLDTSIQVKTDHFDGPLGLLLLLIQKEQMSIKDLDLTKITEQYLDYLYKMQDLDFDIAGDYLFMAATLLLLKSNTAISEEEAKSLKDELGDSSFNIVSESELIRRLEELQKFQKLSEKLWSLPKRGEDIFVRPKINRKAIIDSILTPVELNKITSAMMDLMIREKRKYTVVKRDRLSIKEKLSFLKRFLKEGSKNEFEKLLQSDGGENKDNVVITFISLLELARLKRISIFQNEAMGKIYIDVIKSLDDFSVESADGFEDENDTADSEVVPEIPESALLDNNSTTAEAGLVQ